MNEFPHTTPGWAETVDGAAEFHTVTVIVGFIDNRTNDPTLDLPAIFWDRNV